MILSTALKGVTETNRALAKTTAKIDAVTVVAMRASQRKLVTAVRANLKGAPRWNHRGAGKVYDHAVTVGGSKHSPRSGGPGKLTGDLYRGVGGKKKPVSSGGRIEGGVGVGGGRVLRQNNLKKRWEKKYPFFAPAVKGVQDKLPAIYEAAWKTALNRRGGL